jgi:hypothetical protein
MAQSSKALIVTPDNPYLPTVQKMQKAMKTVSQVHSSDGYKQRRITVIEETDYFPGGYTRIYHNETLRNLSPDACKILITMSLIMEWNDEKINLTPEVVQLERRKFSKAMVELLQEDLLRKEKPHWYWINITVFLMGHIKKEEQ